MRIDPPPAISNKAVAFEKSFPNWLTATSKTPSPRSSCTPMQLTLTAWLDQAPRTPPMEWVGYHIGG